MVYGVHIKFSPLVLSGIALIHVRIDFLSKTWTMLVDLILKAPVNNFLVMSGRSHPLPGYYQYFRRVNVKGTTQRLDQYLGLLIIG